MLNRCAYLQSEWLSGKILEENLEERCIGLKYSARILQDWATGLFRADCGILSDNMFSRKRKDKKTTQPVEDFG